MISYAPCMVLTTFSTVSFADGSETSIVTHIGPGGRQSCTGSRVQIITTEGTDNTEHQACVIRTSKHKQKGVSQYLLFQHNISFINRQVQATLVFENKSYPKHFFLNSCKFEDRNLIYLHLILNSITQPCPMYYIHVIDNPFFTQKSIETHFE